jgi:translation initiation factor IF-2
LEAILLTAEEIRPRANPKAPPTGTVVEARIERGRGPMTTVLVQNGTLKTGDTLIIGDHYGRIKAMYDYRGKTIKQADPATPVSISGLNGLPQAGEQFRIVDNEKTARRIIAEIEIIADTTERRGASLDDFFTRLLEGEAKTLNLIVKADVQGSLEPLVTSLEKLDSEEVGLDILRAATGNISESDIMLASASGAVVLGFNVEVDSGAHAAAASERVEIHTYAIIYKLLEDIEKALKGMLDPVYEDVTIGRAEVREVFRIRNIGAIAGCYMRSGEGRRNVRARVVRNEKVLHVGSIGSLKHLQENVREIKAGFEFGVSVDGWQDYQPGDEIEFFVNKRV